MFSDRESCPDPSWLVPPPGTLSPLLQFSSPMKILATSVGSHFQETFNHHSSRHIHLGYWPSLACSVKMAGYCPSFSLQKELGQYLAILTEQAWSIKDLWYGAQEFISCGTQHVIPSGQSRAPSCLHAQVAIIVQELVDLPAHGTCIAIN